MRAAVAKPITRVLQPRAVPQGRRVRATGKKQHKDKPKVGRGEYVKAPLLRDKLTRPRWLANAAVNNPGNALAVGGVGAGGGYLALHDKKDVSKADHDREKTAAAGAALAGGAGHLGRVGGQYGAKELATRQMKPLTNKGDFGPYKEGPHKAALKAHEKAAGKAGRAGQGARTKAQYFSDNFPKGVPSHRTRQIGQALGKRPAKAAAVLVPAAIGAGIGATRKVEKSMTISAFGIDHGVISKLDYGEGKKPSTGRKVLASTPYAGLAHPFVAGKKGKKMRSAGNQLGGGIVGGTAGSIAGSAAGAVLSRGNPRAAQLSGSAGGMGGAIYGQQRGLARNTRKGYLKDEKGKD